MTYKRMSKTIIFLMSHLKIDLRESILEVSWKSDSPNVY